MNNEIGRKITSLTLMTIMLAGGMTFAVPGVIPAAHAANSNLFVSAENAQFENYMTGPQVIEVIVINSDINDTSEGEGEPVVTVNGNRLRMVQATDGNWYAYFADRAHAQIADGTVSTTNYGYGLDFGRFCEAATGEAYIGFDVSETVGIAIGATDGVTGGTTGATAANPFTACTGTGEVKGNSGMNVVREAKEVNLGNTNVLRGQIGLTVADDVAAYWPFIQLYDLSVGGNVNIEYNPGSGLQSTSLTFDTAESFASVELDRDTYPTNAQVHVKITDLWLNIDPTDEDVWTFGTNADDDTQGTYYQLSDENGATAVAVNAGTPANDAAAGAINLKDTLDALSCETNCELLLDLNAQNVANNVLTIQTNQNSLPLTGVTDPDDASTFGVMGYTNLGANSVPVTVVETGPKTGEFITYDESDTSVLKITSDAARRTSATLTYNEDGYSIKAGFTTASIEIQTSDDTWNSGEDVPIVIVDADANTNSRADEDLDVSNPDVTIIPTLETGDPFTLGEGRTNDDGNYDLLLFDTAIIDTATPPLIQGSVAPLNASVTIANSGNATMMVQPFSQRGMISNETGSFNEPNVGTILIDLGTDLNELHNTISDNSDDAFTGFNLFNYDVRSFGPADNTVDVFLVNSTEALFTSTNTLDLTSGANATALVLDGDGQGYVSINATNQSIFNDGNPGSNNIGLLIQFDPVGYTGELDPIVADFFSFGFENDGLEGGERIANQIIRIEAEESGDNTNTFNGLLEYIMINQLNINDLSTYTGLSTIADDPTFIVIEDLTDEDAVRVNYLDTGSDGVVTQISAQEDAPSHGGTVSLDADSYKIADTVVITLDDPDLNADSDLIDIYTVVTIEGDTNRDVVGSATVANGGTSVPLSTGDQLGRLLDVTFDDIQWTTPNQNSCFEDNGNGVIDADAPSLEEAVPDNTGLGATGFTLEETSSDSGVFVGDFQIPQYWCRTAGNVGEETGVRTTTADSPQFYEGTTGLDIEVNYVDFRDASGETNEVGDSAGVRASTGSVSLDRTVYPVPFGVPGDYNDNQQSAEPNGRSVFPIHSAGIGGNTLDGGEFLDAGDLIIHVRVNDPDYDVSGSGEDSIAATTNDGVGPVKVSVIRGSAEVVLTYAGGEQAEGGLLDVVDDDDFTAPEFGPIDEIAPDAGIFEADITIRYTDGPASNTCPNTTVFTPTNGTTTTTVGDRFSHTPDARDGDYCILQGDILQVEYTDLADASGDVNTVTDSATFDLRNGVLQSDKSVYIIGSDMILTLIEPDLDLDNDQAESYDLDLIEWDSDAATVSMGDAGGSAGSFDPEPLNFRETGDSTGIFQVVIEIPEALDNDPLERGEEIVLEYTDWGPSGSDYVGDEDEDIDLTVFTSNFGATIELDQKVYSWTDKIYITIVAPDHNFDGDLVDEIGNSGTDPIKISTRGFELEDYKLVETGTDTGIFTGEVILTGFEFDADGDGSTDNQNARTEGSGPTDGFLQTDDDDGLTVSFEFSEDETVVGSSLIRWNIAEVQWLEASYPATGTGVIRVIDPDVNLDPESVDNFDIDVYSDSDAGGIDLTVTETQEATGIFEGTVFFTIDEPSSGHRLRVAEGDTVTAEYEDNTLPKPYTTADELDVTATSLIGTVVEPLSRAPASNLHLVDAFGNSIDAVAVDQQVQVSADLTNGQDKQQTFAYLAQIQDANGVTVSLEWISGSLAPNQSLTTAASWIPTESGTYTITAFVWESIDTPTALSPPISTTVSVN